MKKLKLLSSQNFFLIAFAIFTFTSCNISYKSEMKTKRKKGEGVDYVFSNHAEYKNFKVLFINMVQLKSKISFYGMEKIIIKEISKSDFEEKIDLKNIQSFHIDSVSFLINGQKDRIDLIYFLNVDNENKSVKFTLHKDSETWNFL